MKPLERWVAIVGIAVLSFIAVAGFATAVYAAWLFHDMPNAADLTDYRPPTATRVYAWDGTLIGEFSRERRIFVPYDQIPTQLSQAFLAAEDKNFFQHSGVDLAGVSRAMLKNVANLAQGRRLEGASTITQQVAKNVLLTNEATLGRKIKNMILAGRLEQTLDKQQILELYLNEIWLGYRSYGVGAAAYNYFGKSLPDLTLAECAYLASLPKGPDNYHPIRQKAAAIARRNWVLGQMAENGWVTRAAAEAAMKDDLKVQSAPQRAKYRDADYFVEEVRQRALSMFGPKLDEGGYYMRTTLDPQLQTAARKALMDGLESYDRRHGWRGAWGRLEQVTPGWEKAVAAKSPPAERTAWRGALVEQAGGQVRVHVADGGQVGWLAPEDVAWARGGKGLSVGDLVFVEPDEARAGVFRLRQVPLVNGAIVAMDPHTGRVLALVGGYSYSLSKFNRATQAERQPGSAFKPFVYATALESGAFTPASIVYDAPISLPGAKAGEVWSPENYEHEYLGPLVFRRGLELSLNTMTVRIAQQVGMKKIVDTAKRFGIVKDMQPVLSMALGAGETTPFNLTAAYASLANGGRKIEPHLIELVEDPEGKTVFRTDKRDCPRCDAGFNGDESPRIAQTGQQLMDPITVYQIDLMLQGVVLRGTAAAAHSLGRPLAGKTGTTNESRSAWFMGFSPDIVVGTFIGFDDNRTLGGHETGAVAALPVFMDFMKTAMKTVPNNDFTPPMDVKFAVVGPNREAFRPGTEPHGPIEITPDAAEAAAPAEGAPGVAPGTPAPPPVPAPAAAPPPNLGGLF